MSVGWPFMVSRPLPVQPGVVCAACEKAEAPRPLLTPLCDECSDRLAGFGLVAKEQRPAPDTP